MSTLVEQLRAVDHGDVADCFLQSPLFGHAADEIERLQTENARLQAMLVDQTERFVQRILARRQPAQETKS
jgi:hypothetical protein